MNDKTTIIIEKHENGFLIGKIKENPNIIVKAFNIEQLMSILRIKLEDNQNTNPNET